LFLAAKNREPETQDLGDPEEESALFGTEELKEPGRLFQPRMNSKRTYAPKESSH